MFFRETKNHLPNGHGQNKIFSTKVKCKTRAITFKYNRTLKIIHMRSLQKGNQFKKRSRSVG